MNQQQFENALGDLCNEAALAGLENTANNQAAKIEDRKGRDR